MNTTDSITRMADSPIIKLLSWAANILLCLLLGIVAYSYKSDSAEIKEELKDINRTLSSYTVSQATVQIRLQQLETTSGTHTTNISRLRDEEQSNGYNIDRLNEILKVNTSRSRPGGTP